jgi:hypothetical protein
MHIHKCEVRTKKFKFGGLHEKQPEVLGTISAFVFRHRETKENLCRGGWSQDLPDTDFKPAVRQLKHNMRTRNEATKINNNNNNNKRNNLEEIVILSKRNTRISELKNTAPICLLVYLPNFFSKFDVNKIRETI